jgi:hypothetical protein
LQAAIRPICSPLVPGITGGTGPLRRVVPVTILRPDVLDKVELFIRINQSPAALSAHVG